MHRVMPAATAFFLLMFLFHGQVHSANPVENGGFESGLTGWNYEGGAGSYKADSNNPRSGKACLLVADDDSKGDVWTYTDHAIQIAQGRSYRLEVWVRADKDQSTFVSIAQFKATGEEISGHMDFNVGAGPKWTRFSVMVRTLDPAAASIRIFLRPVLWTGKGERTGKAWFDDVVWEEVPDDPPVLGRWLRKGGPVQVWQSPIEQKVHREKDLIQEAPSAERIDIAAARGEVESFQIVLDPLSADELRSVQVSDFRRPDGKIIGASAVSTHEVAYINVTEPTDYASFKGWNPDPIPLINYPLQLSKGQQQPIWFNLTVPESSPAGFYQSQIVLGFASGPDIAIPLQLRVWRFDLPRTHHFRTSYALSPDNVDRYHHLDGNPEDRRQVFALYLDAFAAHRTSPHNPFGDDVYKVTFPGYWADGKIVPDPLSPSSGNHVLQVDDRLTDANVDAGTETSIPVNHEQNYTLSWRFKTAGRHDLLVSINQYDGNDNYIPNQNIDFVKQGDGSWQKAFELISSEMFTQETCAIRIHLYARMWTDDGRLTGRTWFDDVDFLEDSSVNLVTNGDFETQTDELDAAADFTEFDQAASHALDTLGFDSYNLPLPFFASGNLNEFNPPPRLLGYDWPTPEYEKAFTKALRIVTDHLAERGWLERAYAYWFDEPVPATYDEVNQGMAMLKRADPRVKRFLTVQFVPLLEGSVDIWVPPIERYQEHWATERQVLGEEVWWYVYTGPRAPYATNFIDHPGIEHRIRYWMAWRYHVQGDALWETNYWTNDDVPEFKPPNYQDPWEDPQSYYMDDGKKMTFGNGDGRLIYPPRSWKDGEKRIKGPTSSIRWELIREGIEDYEAFVLLNETAGELERKGIAPKLAAKARRLLKVPATIISSKTQYTDNPELLTIRRQEINRTIEQALHRLELGR